MARHSRAKRFFQKKWLPAPVAQALAAVENRNRRVLPLAAYCL